MVTPKKILMISPCPAYPTTLGNRARVRELRAAMLRLGHDVHFCHIQREQGDTARMRQEMGDRFHALEYQAPTSTWRRRVKKLQRKLGLQSQYLLPVDAWWDPGCEKYLLDLQARYNFSVVIAEYVFFSKALQLFGDDVLKIVDTHDKFTNRHQIYLNKGLQPEWFSTTQREETRALGRADLVLAIQQQEADWFQSITTTQVVNVGHMVVLSDTTEPGEVNKILYLGSDNPINQQSLKWFLQEVFVHVRAKIPELTLLVGGSVGQHFRDVEGLEILGMVDDLAEAYDRVDIVINPMQLGTGLKIKTLEALGFAKALLTTSVGAHGLPANDAFVVADDATAQVQQLLRLLEDKQARRDLQQRALTYARSWNDAVSKNLSDLLG